MSDVNEELARQTRENIERHRQANSYEGKQAAAIARQEAAFKRDARLAYPGSDEQFEADWPRILSSWKAKQAIDGASRRSRRSSVKF